MSVFISHARADAAFADQLCAFLDDEGFSVVLDRQVGSDSWQRRHERMIADADCVVFVLTPTSADSATCGWDVGEALRIGKRVVLVLPGPLTGISVELAHLNSIYFYSDPAVPNSGFFDGQRRLRAALRDSHERGQSYALPRNRPSHDRQEARAIASARLADEKERRMAEKRELKQQRKLARATQGGRKRGGFPFLRVTFLGLVAAAVIGVVIKPDILDAARGMIGTATAALAAPEEPYTPMSVPAEAFAPERALVAGRAGANVRNYPLTSGELVVEAPPGTRFRVTGRANVQGQWWFRVVLEDGRIGFVREDVVFWERSTPAVQVAGFADISPAIEVAAGRAGAKVRVRPSRSAEVIVRVPANAAMSATGKARLGQHWWVRVTLADGRAGFVRDDVLATASRQALDL
jgi:hypothetical protein